jgi:hypothetical protein
VNITNIVSTYTILEIQAPSPPPPSPPPSPPPPDSPPPPSELVLIGEGVSSFVAANTIAVLIVFLGVVLGCFLANRVPAKPPATSAEEANFDAVYHRIG